MANLMERLRALWQRFLEWWNRFTIKQKTLIVSSAAGVMVLIAVVVAVVTKPQFQTVMESFSNFVMERSDKVRRVLDDYDIAMESATMDSHGIFSVNSKTGRLFIAPETKYRKELKSLIG